MVNRLEQLRQLSLIACDSADIEAHGSQTDATTNPSLILAASQKPQYRHLSEEAKNGLPSLFLDKLCVNFGVEILKLIPGSISTQIDARLSFDAEKTLQRARKVINLYEESGISRKRVLIKLASTWEGIRAAEILEKEGIRCNMTLLFCLPQAIACAEAGAHFIAPYVGRISDWYKKNEGVKEYPPKEDPGVLSVKQIYNYLKKFNYQTSVMAASFRNVNQILELAGCDSLTIAPQLLEELKMAPGPIERKLDPVSAKITDMQKISLDEKTFRLMLNDNPMAAEKLAEGIRKFSEDAQKLERSLLN